MGTRNLTAVMLNGKYVVAQYGQWDGNPGGQGRTALEFCLDNLQTQEGKEKFKKQLARTRFITEQEIKKVYAKIGVKSDATYLDMDQATKFDELLPHLDRDHGAEILQIVLNSQEKEILLQDSIEFAGDSLFCEYAYVIDLDKNTFEAYKGFQESPIAETERFYSFKIEKEHRQKKQYYPVALVASWSLDSLPTVEKLCKVFKTEEDEDYEEEQEETIEDNSISKEVLDKLEQNWLAMPDGDWSTKQFREFGSNDYFIRTVNGNTKVMAEFVDFGNIYNRQTLANSKKDMLTLIAYVRELEEKLNVKDESETKA